MCIYHKYQPLVCPEHDQQMRENTCKLSWLLERDGEVVAIGCILPKVAVLKTEQASTLVHYYSSLCRNKSQNPSNRDVPQIAAPHGVNPL